MLEFFNFARKRRLSYASEALQTPSEASGFAFVQLQTLQMDRSGNASACAQQVVLSLEGSVKIPGAAKKALALKLVGELLEELGIVAPDSLIDVSVEAAARLLKALDVQSLPLQPRGQPSGQKLDISGRPASGNSEKGLSL